MKILTILFVFLIVLVTSIMFVASTSGDSNKTEKDIDKLVKQLGDDDWQTRETAQNELNKMGDTVFPLLYETIIETNNPEIKTRCRTIIRNLIIVALKDKELRVKETEELKEIRQTHINALLNIVLEYQNAVKGDRLSEYAPIETFIIPAVSLLGDFRAVEAVKPLIELMCFEIDNYYSKMGAGLEDRLQIINVVSSCSATLLKIGNPSIPVLIELLKVEPPDDYTGEIPAYTYAKRNLVARKTLYMIEGECAVSHMERALKDEKDKTKNKNLSNAIAKFKEELKSGAYNK